MRLSVSGSRKNEIGELESKGETLQSGIRRWTMGEAIETLWAEF